MNLISHFIQDTTRILNLEDPKHKILIFNTENSFQSLINKLQHFMKPSRQDSNPHKNFNKDSFRT